LLIVGELVVRFGKHFCCSGLRSTLKCSYASLTKMRISAPSLLFKVKQRKELEREEWLLVNPNIRD